MCPLHFVSTSILPYLSTPLLPLTALLRLTRPHNALAAALCTLLGAHLARGDAGSIPWPRLMIPAATMALVVGAVTCLNDVVDHVEDRHNAPHRPIPSGAVSRRGAALFALALLGVAGALVLQLDASLALLGVAMTIVSVAYAIRLKRTVLVGNLIVGAVSGATVLFGAHAVRSLTADRIETSIAVLTAFGLVSLFVFAREVLKSITDFDGDLRAGHATTATRLGLPCAMAVFRLLAISFALTTLVPWRLGIGGWPYLLPMAAGATVPLMWLAIAPQPAPASLRRWLRATKVSWFVGLAGLATLR